jgi:hypothetical protein
MPQLPLHLRKLHRPRQLLLGSLLLLPRTHLQRLRNRLCPRVQPLHPDRCLRLHLLRLYQLRQRNLPEMFGRDIPEHYFKPVLVLSE